jgi:peptidoglycan/xylan/chitin deacetylase (PgdA/CDA1 family)
MMLSQGLFWQQVQQLTGRNFVFPELDCKLVIPEKYHLLFSGKLVEGKVAFRDIVEVVDYVLLRKEEGAEVRLDKFGRFDRNCSKLANNGYDQSPIIDELILDVIKQLNLNVRSIWPEGKKAAVCLTHDVDLFDGRSYLFLRKMLWMYHAFVPFIRGNKIACKQYKDKIKRWSDSSYDPVYAFDKWMELEDSYGFRSTFFFFGLRYALSREGRLYSCQDQEVRNTIRRLDENGWEIGLHAGYYHHLKLDYLKEQKNNLEKALGKNISGCRQHFLRVRFPESWEMYEDAGFAYSTNMAWGAGNQGFRAGTCFPYRPFKGGSLIEIPFQLMDMAIIENPVEYHSLFLDYLQKAKKVDGCLVINFHQEYFDEIEAPGTNEAYRMILETLSEDQELWVVSLSDVCTQICSVMYPKSWTEK